MFNIAHLESQFGRNCTLPFAVVPPAGDQTAREPRTEKNCNANRSGRVAWFLENSWFRKWWRSSLGLRRNLFAYAVRMVDGKESLRRNAANQNPSDVAPQKAAPLLIHKETGEEWTVASNDGLVEPLRTNRNSITPVEPTTPNRPTSPRLNRRPAA